MPSAAHSSWEICASSRERLANLRVDRRPCKASSTLTVPLVAGAGSLMASAPNPAVRFTRVNHRAMTRLNSDFHGLNLCLKSSLVATICLLERPSRLHDPHFSGVTVGPTAHATVVKIPVDSRSRPSGDRLTGKIVLGHDRMPVRLRKHKNLNESWKLRKTDGPGNPGLWPKK